MESFIIFASLGAAFYWFKWYIGTWPGNLNKMFNKTAAWLLLLVPVLAMTIIWFVIWYFAASDVVTDIYYIGIYLGLGLVWLKVAEFLFRFLGISAENDVVERGNLAALIAYAGGLIGVALCYAGGNIGEGPGPQAVIICAGIATVALFVVWFALSAFTEIDYTVTVDRDMATGIRMGSFLLAAGLILGRSVMGNYYSAAITWNDFLAHGWPVLVLLAVAIIFEFFTRPTVERPVPSIIAFGVLPALIYLGSAVLYVVVGHFPV